MKHPYFWKTTVILLQVMCLLGIFGICYAGYYKAGNSIISMAQIDGGKYENTEYYLNEVNRQIVSLSDLVQQEEMFKKDESGRMSYTMNMNSYGYDFIEYEVETLLNAQVIWSAYTIVFSYESEELVPEDGEIILPAEARRIVLESNAEGLSQKYLEEVKEEAKSEGENYNWILYDSDGRAIGGMKPFAEDSQYDETLSVQYNFSILNEKASGLRTKEGKSLLEYCKKIPIYEYQNAFFVLGDMIENVKYAYDNYQQHLYQASASVCVMIAGVENECLYNNGSGAFVEDLYTAGDKWLKTAKENQDNYNYIYFNSKNFRMETSLNVDTNQLYDWYMDLGDIFDHDFAAAITIPAGDISNYEMQDALREGKILYDQIRPQMKYYVSVLLGCLIVFIILLIAFTSMCGRSKSEGITVIWFDKIPTEIAICIMLGLALFGWCVTVAVFKESLSHMSNLIYLGMDMTMVVILHLLFLFGYSSLVRRMKAGVLWKNSIVKMLWTGAVFCFSHIHETVTTLAGYVVFLLFNIFMTMMAFLDNNFYALVIMLVIDALVGGCLLYEAYIRHNIQKAVKRISDGDITYQMDTSYIQGSYRKLVDNLNHIGEGLQGAVDANMKNERLKTDLITNVSHDIKTPLTSIINYIGLIKREDVENERIREYVNVLDQKAQRLKSLTEDLVEVSRITSGNIVLQIMPLDFVEIVQQTAAEFDEKFEERNLQLIMNFPPESITIHADGRRLYRVIENLFNNVAKYAMPATRVYVDIFLETGGSKAVLSVKNISENPLNIQEKDLTERFIRGDVSRTTEGSGLGLSIAKNLTEAQGGVFEIYLDGDLFRVTITFPRIRREFAKVEEEKGQEE